MRTKHALSVLAPIALILQLGSAWAAPDREMRTRWAEAIEPQASKIILHNLSARPAEASLGSEAVAISADGVAEISVSGAGQLRSNAALLVLQAADGFDPASLEVDKSVSDRPGKLLLRAAHPTWTRELVAGVARIRHGATGAVDVKSADPAARVEVTVELLAPHTSVRIRQFDSLSNEVASLVAFSPKPVRWRATLEPVGGVSRIELKTLRGEAQGTAAAVVKSAATSSKRSPIDPPVTSFAGGLAKFEPTINWQYSANLYYKITGAPASVCGDSYVSRNGGSYVVTPGWVCTDASGNATKGPWTYANQPGDEDAYAYAIWPDGSSTNTARHIWDKTAPSVYTNSFGSVPPGSFSGTAYDGPYGSGFSANFGSAAGGGSSLCRVQFKNTSTGLYWCSGYSSYSSSVACTVTCTISGMPSRSVTWSADQVPPGYAHLSGDSYEWKAIVYDNYNLGKSGTATRSFYIPL